MAGFIHIKDGNGLSVGSITFNAIAEFTRPYFSHDDMKFIDEIYAPLDEGALDAISLDEQQSEGFNAYYRGVRSAYEDCMRMGKCGNLGQQYFDMVMRSWRELLDLLERDERYLGKN